MRFGWTAIVVACALLSCAQETQISRMVRQDPQAPYTEVMLSQVMATPDEYLQADIEFDCIFNKVNEDFFVPVYTPFTQERHVSMSVWVPGARLWDAQDNNKSLVRTVYVRKDNPMVNTVVKLHRYQPIHIRGSVRSHFENIAWIEVYLVDATAKQGSLNSNSLSMMLNGQYALAEKKIPDAIRYYNAAIAEGIPWQAEKEVYLSLGRALAAFKTPQQLAEAQAYYAKAVELDPEDVQLQIEASKCKGMTSEPMPPQNPGVERNPNPTPAADPALKDENDKLKAKLAEKDAEIAKLNEAMSKNPDAAELEKLKKERDEREKAAMDFKAGKEQAEADFKKHLDECKAKMDEIDKKIADAAAQVEARTKELDEAKKNADAATAKMADLQKQIDELSKNPGAEQMAALQKQLDESKAAKDAADKKTGELTAKVTELEAKIKEMGNQTGGNAEDLKKLQDELAKVKEDAAKAKDAGRDEASKEYEEVIAKLRDTIKKQREELDEAYKKLKDQK